MASTSPISPRQILDSNIPSSDSAPPKDDREQLIDTLFHLLMADKENLEAVAKENSEILFKTAIETNQVSVFADIILSVGHQLAAKKPFNVLKLEHLRENIRVLTGTPLPEIEEAINRCQEEALQQMTVKDKSEIAKHVTGQDHMTEFRNRTFKHFYTQIKVEKPEYWHSTKEILTQLIKRTEEMMTQSGSNLETLKEIYDRAKKNLESLNKGESVKIASLYHGTSTTKALVNILKSSIWSSDAAYGKGAYLSSKMEQEYGPYYLSFDLLDLASEKLAPENQANRTRIQTVTNSIWRAFKDNVSTQDNRVAFVVAPTKEAAASLRELLAKENLGHIDVRTHEAVELERSLLEDLRGIIEPKEWQSEWQASHNLFSALLDIKLPKTPQQQVEEPDNEAEWD